APGAAAPAAPAAAGTADGVVYELSDKDLTFLVLNKIRLGYKGSTVSVNCAAGRVELFGQVPTEETRQRLIADVRKLPGVREVVARELFVAP
ncbi:MAG: BON domain-containing protein, partial [Acidobacteria bacterium]|nr:BON domain-containing protein [Acidobacteriota bacterium]